MTKELINEIIDFLMKVPHMNKNILMAMINPLKNENQLKLFLQYLKDNEDNTDLMRIDNLLKVRTNIVKLEEIK